MTALPAREALEAAARRVTEADNQSIVRDPRAARELEAALDALKDAVAALAAAPVSPPLIEALAFYADPESYSRYEESYAGPMTSDVQGDAGARARAALTAARGDAREEGTG